MIKVILRTVEKLDRESTTTVVRADTIQFPGDDERYSIAEILYVIQSRRRAHRIKTEDKDDGED